MMKDCNVLKAFRTGVMCWLCKLQLERNVEILCSDHLLFQVKSNNSMDTAMHNESVVVHLVTRRVEAHC